MSQWNRRQFVMKAGALASSVRFGFAAGDPSYFRDFPDMLLSHLTGKLNSLATHWDRQRDAIRTAADLEARNRFVREKFREMIHGYPDRNALAPVVVRKHQRDGYWVENVMFQSRPNFWVTGNLYVPTSGKPPFPGIISPCGHYPLARMQPDYQYVYLNLVKSGFVVLAYDPIGQGERRQYWDPQTGVADIPDPIYEHSMPGQVLLMMGEDLTHYRVWDGIRAIDYLLTRPEVDSERIGCAGHSGGGTLTLFISALDERVKCAVVNEGGTGHRWPIDLRPETRIGPSDVEQNFFPGAKHGVDLCDLHVAIAPRPLLALIENYSPRFNRAAEHIRARYLQLGVPEKFATEEATDPHAWTLKLRLASTDWMCRWLYGRKGPAREPEFEAERPETLYCTPNGSLRYSQQGETIFSLLVKKQDALPPRIDVPASARDVAAFREKIGARIRDLLRYHKPEGSLDVRQLVVTPRKGYRVEKLEFLAEPGIYIPAWVFVPEKQGGPVEALLLVNEAGKQADGMEFGLCERLARQGRLVVAVDVRGVGETQPRQLTPSIRSGPYGHLFSVETAMAYMTWYADESLFGMRVQDVVRSVDYTLSRPDVVKTGLRLVGKGAGALWVLYAAALDSRITSVVAERGLLSYRNLAKVDRYTHSAGIFVRDVLLNFDLPQVAAAVADRKLTLLSPVDAVKSPVSSAAVREAYRWTVEAYRAAGAADRFRIVPGSEDANLSEVYFA
jgi:cephalosporin-C deacetylase-like acetyl esterase